MSVQFQEHNELNIKINHRQHKKVLLCTIVVFSLWIILKLISSLLAVQAPKERDIIHLIGLSSYTLCTDITAIIFIFHFIFLIKNLSIRLEMFHQSFYAEMILRNWNDDCNQIRTLEIYSILFRFFISLIGLINLVFRLQVIHQFGFFFVDKSELSLELWGRS